MRRLRREGAVPAVLYGHGEKCVNLSIPATEVSSALVTKAFTDLDVRVVWGATMALNTASQHVMEKVGMSVTEVLETPEDMLAVEGSELGGFRYEITKEQWERRQLT